MSDKEFLPLEGNSALVRSKAEHYGQIADAIIRSVSTLTRIKDSSNMTSEAISAIREQAGKVADDIEKARNRYSGTSKALIVYSHALRGAQDDANTAIAHINDKQHELAAAGSKAHTAKTAADAAADEDKATADKTADAADAAVASASHALSAAHSQWHSALTEKNHAADAAIAAIVEVVDGKKSNDLNDGWWDDWGSKLLDVLKIICDIAGVLAIFLAWVPILGEVLLILAAVGAIIALVESIVKAVNGDGSWTDVIWAAAGAVMTIFGGKLLELTAKSFKALTIVKVAEHLVDGALPAEMARIQGVGAHSAEFMNFSQASNEIKSFKDLAPQAFKLAFKPGAEGATAGEIIRASLKENFLPQLLNKDLAFALKTAAQHPGILTLPYVVQGASITVMQGVSDAIKIHEALNGFDIHNPQVSDLGRIPDALFEGVHKVNVLVEDSHKVQENFRK